MANAVRQYNVSFRDVLPPGVTYKPGTTTPADVGDPTVFTAQVHFPTATSPLVPQQTLVWSNVADLPLGGTVAIGYQVVPPSALYPVGSTVTNTAQDFSSINPRVVPKFDKTGTPVDSPVISVGPPRTVNTTISAITIEKSSDASPEGKLLRGVHDNVSIYTLLITNNDDDATNGNQVTDYLPANLEFLGCGRADNTTVGPEYPGAPALGIGRIPVDDCRTPTSVQTVTNPTPALTGVFTKVVWAAPTVPNLAPGDTYTIRYAAAVPLRDNTMVFPGGTPSPASGQQGSNLDNNTGPSTRQDGNGQAVTNTAGVAGRYQGPTVTDPTGATGTPVSDDTTHTVTAKDVRLLKSVQTNGDEPSKQDDFTIGQIATYTLEVDTSEYASAQDITITDHLPNGVCPLVSQTDWNDLVAAHPSLSARSHAELRRPARPGPEERPGPPDRLQQRDVRPRNRCSSDSSSPQRRPAGPVDSARHLPDPDAAHLPGWQPGRNGDDGRRHLRQHRRSDRHTPRRSPGRRRPGRTRSPTRPRPSWSPAAPRSPS